MVASHAVFGDSLATGNTLMVPTDPNNEEVNNYLLDSSEGFISGFPCDGVLERAYLFWTGSTDIATDNDADITFADGDGTNVIADQCYTVPSMGGFFYCRADITEILRGHTTGCAYNGMYVVGGVEAMEGDYSSPDPNNGPCFAQGKYAAWSLILVYSEPEGLVPRDIVIYDGFLQLDEDSYNPGCGMSNPQPGVDSFNIGGFEVGSPPSGKLMIFGLEGDDQLGIPPQTTCSTCYDYLKFNGTKLFDASNYANNLFNGSTSVTGVDIDQFDIGETGFNLIQPGQTVASIEVGSGDGCVSYNDPSCDPDPEGGGESFFLGWMVVSLDTISPLFVKDNTKIWFDRPYAGRGEEVWMTIRVQNDGNADAHDVVVWNTLPAGLEYVAGTTSVDGDPQADVGGTSPLHTAQGLYLGRIRWDSDRDREITLKVKVGDDEPNGIQLCSSATIDSLETDPFDTDPTDPCLTVRAPDIADPVLSVEDVNGGFAEPGDVLRYRATLTNNGSQPAYDLSFTMDLPPYVKDLQIISRPPDSEDHSTQTGGANGTGFLDIRDITVHGIYKDSIEIVFDVTIFSEQELLDAGVPASGIDGLQLPAQGLLSGPPLDDDLPTNLLIVTLTFRPLLEGTRKYGLDMNGGRTEPGDILRYTIEINNVGNQGATVDVTDDLPQGVIDCAIVSGPPTTTCVAPPAGANGTGQVTATDFEVLPGGGQVVIVYEVRIAPGTQDGLQVVNSALIEVEERPDENRVVAADSFMVFYRAQFDVAEKSVVDMNGGNFEPGDMLTFELRFVNDGNRPATNVVVSDTIDDNLGSIVPGQGGVFAGGQINWSIPSIAPGEEIILSFTAVIDSPLDNGTIIQNQGLLVANEVIQPVPTNLVSFSVISAPDLSTTTKTVITQDLDSDGQVSPGDRVDYTIEIHNTGNSVASNVVVTDQIDPYLENVVVGQGGVLSGDTITWDVGDMGISPAVDVILTFSAVIASPLVDGTIISNQAFAAADELASQVPSDDPGTSEVDDPTDIVVHSQAVVTATKTVSDQNGGDPMPGDTLLYIITIQNSGNAPATNITVADVLESELQNPQPDHGGQVTGNTVNWDAGTTPGLGSLIPGSPVVLSFTADLLMPLADGTLVCNQASITGGGFSGPVVTDDPSVPGSGDPTCITVSSYPVLSASTKVAQDLDGDGHFNPGDRIQYQILVRNTGTEEVHNVNVSDQIDANLENISVGQGGTLAGNTVSWTPSTTSGLSSMSPGAEVLLTFEADIVLPLGNGTAISNQGMLVSQEVPGPTATDDPATPLPNDPTVIVVESAPDLTQATKNVEDLSGDPDRVEPGDTLRYTILVSNSGTDVVYDLEISDTLDENLENVTPGQNGDFDGTAITWSSASTPDLAELSPLDPPVALTFTATVKVPTQNGTTISNQGFIRRQGDPSWIPTDDPRTSDVDDPTDVTVISASDLTSSTKIAFEDGGTELPPDAQVIPGQRITYELVIRNEGNDSARNVEVRDPVDSSKMNVFSIGQGGQQAGGEVLWSHSTSPGLLEEILPGNEITLSFTVDLLVPLDNGTEIVNQAFISGDDQADEIATDDPRTPALDDPVRLLVSSSADLSTSLKTVEDMNGENFVPGDNVRYTVTLRNSGDALARDVIVTDVVDTARLENIQPGQGGVYTGGVIRWDATTTPELMEVGLSPGGDVQLTFTADIVVPLDDGSIVANQANLQCEGSASVPSDDPSTADVDDPTTFIVSSSVDLESLAKTVLDENGQDPAPGDALTYTIQVSNSGTMSGRNIVVSDPVDETNLVEITPLDGGVLASGEITWDSATTPALALVDPGQVVEIRFTARIRELTPGGTVIDNQAVATSETVTNPVLSDDPATPADNDPTRIIVIASPDFGLSTKSVQDLNGEPLMPGDELSFSIRIRNSGNTYATNVEVVDPIDESLQDVQPGQGGRIENGNIVWDSTAVPALARMDPGDELLLAFHASVATDAPDGTVIHNMARIECPELEDPHQTNEVELVVRSPVLSGMLKEAIDLNGSPFEPDDTIRYTISLPNTGSLNASGVEIRDRVADSILTDIQPLDGGILSGDSIVWSIGNIQAGSEVQVSFTGRIPPMTPGGTEISNQAFATSTEIPAPLPSDDPGTPAQDDPTIVIVEAAPDLSQSTKTVEDLNGGVVKPRDTLRYTISIKNTGNTWADDIVVNDVVDTVNLHEIQPEDGGVLLGNTVRWDASSNPALAKVGLSPDSDVILVFTAKVLAGVPNGTVIGNQASFYCDQLTEPQLSDDPSTPALDDPTRVTVISAPYLESSRKEVVDLNGDLVEPGDELEYTLLIINNGSEPSSGTTIRDSIPGRSSYVSGSTTLNGSVVPDAPGANSPLVNGMLVNSARAGTAEGVVLVDEGGGMSDAVAVVTFRVRVEASGDVCGATIANRGWIWSNETDPVTTNVAEMTVGDCPNLNHTVKGWYLVEDNGAPDIVEPGDVVAYRIAIENTGATTASSVTFTDNVPELTTYQAGTLSLDGAGLTDAVDGDAGEIQGGTIRVRIGDLRAGASATIEFQVRVDDGPRIVNQGITDCSELPQEPTDDDGDELNGDGPTIIPVGDEPGADLSGTRKEVEDLNGGSVMPGDELRYSIRVVNMGTAEARDIRVTDSIPALTGYIAGSLERDGKPLTDVNDGDEGEYSSALSQVMFTMDSMEGGSETLLSFRVRIEDDAELGSLIDNFARIAASNVDAFDSNHVSVIVGGSPGTGGVRGRIFIDKKQRNGSFDAEWDEPLVGFDVSVLAGEGQGEPLASVSSDEQGYFRLMDLQPGPYTLRGSSSTGVKVVIAPLGDGGIEAGRVNEQDLPVDPSGRIYDSSDGGLLAGARVSIYYDETNTQSPGEKVPLDDLPFPSQQDQSTDAYGLYVFDLTAGHKYRLVVEPPSPSWIFPSGNTPPESGFADELLSGGRVVENDLPDPGGDTSYFLRFDIGEEVHNNHVPLDRLDGLLKLSKQVNKRVASVGDIVTYTITLRNGSGQDLTGDWETEGVWIRDRTPSGFVYMDGSARVDVISSTGQRQTYGQINTPSDSEGRGRILEFGPYPLAAGETIKVRYHMALGSDIETGEHDNRATAFIQGGVIASNQAMARVRVVNDPVFDEALLIGKVFCDLDGDKRQNYKNTGEEGIEGARIYIDTGWFAETDFTGKYHLKGIQPGMHLIKIDQDTLPPGSEVVGAEAKAMHLTRGLPAKLNFPVNCKIREISAVEKTASQKEPPEKVILYGDLDDYELNIQGRPVDLPELDIFFGRRKASAAVGEAVEAFKLLEGQLDQALAFSVVAPDEEKTARWNLRIEGPDGPVDSISGSGSPGEVLTWDPDNRVLEPGTYRARLEVTLRTGTKIVSAPLPFGIGITKSEVEFPIYPAGLKVAGKQLEVGDTSGFRYEAPVGPDGAVDVEFNKANGRKVKTRLEISEPPAPVAVEIKGNVTTGKIAVAGDGEVVPLRKLDVFLKVENDEEAIRIVEGAFSAPLSFNIAGTTEEILQWNLKIYDAEGNQIFEKPGKGVPAEELIVKPEEFEGFRIKGGWYRYRLEARDASGAVVRTPMRLFRILAPESREEMATDDLFRGRRAAPTPELREKIDQICNHLESEEDSKLKVEIHTDNRGGYARALRRTRVMAQTITGLLSEKGIAEERFEIESHGAQKPRLPNLGPRNRRMNRRALFSLSSPSVHEMPVVVPGLKLEVDGKTIEADPSGKFTATVEKLPGESGEIVWDDPDGRQIRMPFRLPGPEPAPAAPPAASPVSLRVILPPKDAEIRSEHLMVKGRTDPGNKVEVNGKRADVDPLGKFRIRLPVSSDTREVIVVATDSSGRQSEVRAPVKVAPHVWFLMAMADTAVAEIEAGQHLDGVTKRTSTIVGDKVLLHGRAVMYLKARIKGKYLFDQYRITAHFDTAKGDNEAFFEQIVDPERYYPVYGDSAAEVQDVKARRKLYVLIEADESLLRVGNFRTKLEGIDILRYDRTFYGGQLVLKKDLGNGFDTDVRAHVTDGHEQVRHAHVELQPTGGSLYYLPHSFVLEGSEQIRLTVRDADTGLVLMRVPKQRDVDYTIRYREGRIFFKSPVASTMDASSSGISANFSTAMEGNPVFIEVDYEYEGSRGSGQTSWAVQAHETWREMVRVGGTYIREGRAIDDFVLWGVDLTVQDPDNKATYIKGEFARSKHTDAENFLSADGGLSFSSLGVSSGERYGRPESGDAWKVSAGTELGPYFDMHDPFINLSGYFQWLQPGFFSNGTLTEQGQKKFGGRLVYHLTQDITLDLRHDGAFSEIYLSGEMREIDRQLSRLGYTHKIGDLELGLDYLHSMARDSSLDTGLSHSDAVGARAKYRFSKRWQGFLQQEGIVNAGGLQQTGTFADRMKTSLGVSCNLTKDIDLSLTERVRWSGENATVLGFTTKLSEKAKVYVNERFNMLGNRYVSTTVLGAEDEPLKGVKTYGEYQLNGASSGTTNRAVLGLDNHFTWGKGWSADLHYERTQVFGDGGYGPGLQLNNVTGSATLPDGVTSGTGFEAVPGQAFPGMNSYGSFLAGNSSRDAVGGGLEFKGLKNLKLSLKIEFRYDDADDDIITSSPTGLARTGVKDRLQFIGMAGLSWKWTEDLSFALHLNFADTEALETKKDGVVYVEEANEARIVEGSIGVSFRPVHYDWVALLGKYTILLEKRPVDLLQGIAEQSESHVFTIMPIFELPALRLQLIEKFAWKFVRERVDGMPEASGHTILWINRLNFHLLDELDIGGEYRMLKSFLADDMKQGFLVEVAYILMEKVRIGAGYNFTSFSDNEFARNDYDHGGFFFRVIGQY